MHKILLYQFSSFVRFSSCQYYSTDWMTYYDMSHWNIKKPPTEPVAEVRVPLTIWKLSCVLPPRLTLSSFLKTARGLFKFLLSQSISLSHPFFFFHTKHHIYLTKQSVKDRSLYSENFIPKSWWRPLKISQLYCLKVQMSDKVIERQIWVQSEPFQFGKENVFMMLVE